MSGSYLALAAAAGRLSEDELAGWSRCRGWTRADVLLHVLLDAQRALVTFSLPAAGPPDVDYVSYWEPFKPGQAGAAEHARFVRLVTASYPSHLDVARQFTETATAAARAAEGLPGARMVGTQGHVLAIGDFLATLAVEATIHHLDLLLPTDDASGPSQEGLAVVRLTLDGLLRDSVAHSWDDAAYALAATGRAALTSADQVALGPLASRFPLLG